MAYRIRHIPTGRFFGHPDHSVSGAIQHLKNMYIDLNLNEFKAGTSNGRVKIWTSKLYAERAFKELQAATNDKDWKLEEWK